MSEKLELKDVLGALDLGAREVWDELSEEQKKSVAFFLLNRYMSLVKSTNRDLQEHFVLATNEYFNKHFFRNLIYPYAWLSVVFFVIRSINKIFKTK